jgi:hypothetical protein
MAIPIVRQEFTDHETGHKFTISDNAHFDDRQWIQHVVREATGRACDVKKYLNEQDWRVDIYGTVGSICVMAMNARYGHRNSDMLASLAKAHMEYQPLAPEAEEASTDAQWLRVTIAEICGFALEQVTVEVDGSMYKTSYPTMPGHWFDASSIVSRNREWLVHRL